jgi:hypothetical protein
MTHRTARKVDPELAHEVADAFLAGRDTRRDPMVCAAYGQLEQQSDRVFFAITRSRPFGGVRVSFSRCRMPYLSDREMIAAVRTERQLEVTSVATERDRCHPLMGCEAGGAYDRFRAVHDIVGHVGPCLGFDRDGEFEAWLVQDRLYRGLAQWALATELHAEHSVRWTTGDVSDHKATLLDRDLLARTRAATSTRVEGDDPSGP